MSDLSLYEDIGCRYFKKPGIQNTSEVLEAVARRAEELDIRKVLIATNTGKTAFDALEILDKGIKIIAVTHVTGFAKPNFQELSEESRTELESNGVSVLTCMHALAGIGRGIRNKLSTYQVDEIVAYVLRMFGQGTKVAVELALMAADAGLVRTDEDVISIGGTARGADTALVIQPANSSNVFDLKVKEIICKPSVI
ncbi:MAG: pyruvate kinase alpha/beta domain-containing protein [Syntrophales bacterium]|nr:pyruvate kinase alpha/beta domain-containing protein [Syntrophales bacterium]